MVKSEPELCYQIFDAWATDGNRDPLPLHSHAESTECFTVLAGRVLIAIEEKETIVEQGTCFCISPGKPHAKTPLTADTRAVIVCSPPDPGFAQSLQAGESRPMDPTK